MRKIKKFIVEINNDKYLSKYDDDFCPTTFLVRDAKRFNSKAEAIDAVMKSAKTIMDTRGGNPLKTMNYKIVLLEERLK